MSQHHSRSKIQPHQIVTGLVLVLLGSCGDATPVALDPTEGLSTPEEFSTAVTDELPVSLSELASGGGASDPGSVPAAIDDKTISGSILSVHATDSHAGEPYVQQGVPADLGQIKFKLSKPAPTGGVEIDFSISGTATQCTGTSCQGVTTSPDRDYLLNVTHPAQSVDADTVMIPAGETEATLVVEPLNDEDFYEELLLNNSFSFADTRIDESNETVVITIEDVTQRSSGGYLTFDKGGSESITINPHQSQATVSIQDNDYTCALPSEPTLPPGPGGLFNPTRPDPNNPNPIDPNLLIFPQTERSPENNSLMGGIPDTFIPLGITKQPTLVADLRFSNQLAWKSHGAHGSTNESDDSRLIFGLLTDIVDVPGGLDYDALAVEYFNPDLDTKYGQESMHNFLPYVTSGNPNPINTSPQEWFDNVLSLSGVCSSVGDFFSGLHYNNGFDSPSNQIDCDALFGASSFLGADGELRNSKPRLYSYPELFVDDQLLTDNCESGADHCYGLGFAVEFEKSEVPAGTYWVKTAVLGNTGQCIPIVSESPVWEY